MPTRAALLALPPHELIQLANVALTAAANRHGLLPARAANLPRWMLADVVLVAQLRARAA